MTVPATTPLITYECTGTTDYTYSFKIYEDSDLEVSRDDGLGNVTILTLTTDYTVSGAGTETGGIVTTVATYTDGSISIRRLLDYSQEKVFVDGGPLPATQLNEALDRNVMLMQQLKIDLDDDALQDEILAAQITANAEAAAQSEANAAISEANAATSEANAATSESNAATSESNAATSETNAATSAASAAQDASDALGAMLVCQAIQSAGQRTDALTQDNLTATAGQTEFSLSNATAEGALIVFMNTRHLILGQDFTTDIPTAATKIILGSGAEAGDEITIVAFNLMNLPTPAQVGADGTFNTFDNKTVTVVSGLITDITEQ